MVSCDLYCINEMAVDAYSLLLRIFTFLERKKQHCYELINLRLHLLIVNTVSCKEKENPFHSFELIVLTEFCLDTISVDEIKTYHYVL